MVHLTEQKDHVADYHILVLGARGQIGTNLLKSQWPKGYVLQGVGHEELDVTDKKSLEKKIKSQKWDFIINASGYVQVDKAEQAGQQPYLVNSLALVYLAALGKKYNIPIFHYSTDYVYDGVKNSLYNEQDEFNPLSTYGLSKLFGELSLKSLWEKHIILRSSWVYGLYGRNFVKTMLQKAQEQKEIFVVNDQRGTPTYSEDIVDVTKKIISSILSSSNEEGWGTFHYAGLGETTWYEYAKYVIDLAYGDSKDASKVIGITTDQQRHEQKNITKRPLHSALDSSLIKKTFSVKDRPWKEGVKRVVEQLRTP